MGSTWPLSQAAKLSLGSRIIRSTLPLVLARKDRQGPRHEAEEAAGIDPFRSQVGFAVSGLANHEGRVTVGLVAMIAKVS